MIEVRVESRFTCDKCGKQEVFGNAWSELPDINGPVDLPNDWVQSLGFRSGKPVLLCDRCNPER